MKKNGLTLVETMITLAIGAIMSLGAFTFWVMISQSWTVERLKSHIVQQIEVGIERMKKEIRMSTADPNELVFYGDPVTSNPPYEAISFPLPLYSDTASRIIDRTGGSVNWGSTVIYHVYTDAQNDVTELRRTVFNDRAGLTKAEREAQLAQVVTDGNGANACEGSETTTTETVFTNLVTLAFEGSSKFDGYNPSVNGIRSNNVGFGSILLEPGAHNVKLQIIGKNTASTDYSVGIDYMSLSPSGYPKEGEDYYSTAVPGAGTINIPEDMFSNTNAVWSGNHHLEFTEAGMGSYITLPVYYDEWRETNFDNGNILWDYTKRDQTVDHDYVVKLDGNEETWDASNQIGADKADDPVSHEDQYIRVRISKDCLSCSGSAARVKFSSHSTRALKITLAYFGVSDTNNPQNFDTNKMTPVKLQFGANDYVVIPAGSSVQSDWFQKVAGGLPPVINKNADPKVDYLVSFHVDPAAANANCSTWSSADSTDNSSYILTMPTALTNPETDNWGPFASSKDIFAVEDIFVSYTASGTCTSQIYNTSIDDATYPDYKSISNNSSIPSGTNVVLETRTGDNSSMSDAGSWSTGPSIAMNGKQYAQFRTTLTSTVFPYTVTPEIKSIYINWDPTAPADKRLVDVSGYFTMRPGYGIFKVLIDDRELVKGIEVSMDIEGRVVSGTYNSHVTAEVYPRNTGK